MTDASLTAEASNKKSSLVMTIAAVAVLTLIALGGSWFVGKMIAPAPASPAAAAPEAAAEHGAAKPKAGEHGAGAPSRIKDLEPILTNLAYPTESMVRLEMSIVFRDAVDGAIATAIQQDILAYMRTTSIQQIQGPRGFSYLHDDLKERALLRSQGKVADLVFRTFIIE
jgi:flagellar FliL protein